MGTQKRCELCALSFSKAAGNIAGEYVQARVEVGRSVCTKGDVRVAHYVFRCVTHSTRIKPNSSRATHWVCRHTWPASGAHSPRLALDVGSARGLVRLTISRISTTGGYVYRGQVTTIAPHRPVCTRSGRATTGHHNSSHPTKPGIAWHLPVPCWPNRAYVFMNSTWVRAQTWQVPGADHGLPYPPKPNRFNMKIATQSRPEFTHIAKLIEGIPIAMHDHHAGRRRHGQPPHGCAGNG